MIIQISGKVFNWLKKVSSITKLPIRKVEGFLTWNFDLSQICKSCLSKISQSCLIFLLNKEKSFEVMKYVEKLKFGGDWAELWPKNICSDNTGQDIRKKERNPVKLDRRRKIYDLLLRTFWLLLPKFNFLKGLWKLGYICLLIIYDQKF